MAAGVVGLVALTRRQERALRENKERLRTVIANPLVSTADVTLKAANAFASSCSLSLSTVAVASFDATSFPLVPTPQVPSEAVLAASLKVIAIVSAF